MKWILRSLAERSSSVKDRSRQRRGCPGFVTLSGRRRASDLRWDFWWFRPGNRGDGEPARDGGAGGHGRKEWEAPKALAREIWLRCTEPRGPDPSPCDTYAAATRTACQLATGPAPARDREAPPSPRLGLGSMRTRAGWLAGCVCRSSGDFFIYFCVFSKNKYLISKLSKLAYSLCLKWRLEPTAAVKGSWH
jgi:hypothetical protein